MAGSSRVRNTTAESAQALERQAKIVRERGARYGQPHIDLGRTARLWSAFLGIQMSADDVCALMALLKLSRIREQPEHADSWDDAAAYLAIGGVLAKVDAQPKAV